MRERIACFLWALFLLMTTVGAAVAVFPAEEVQKVAILPFTMNAERRSRFSSGRDPGYVELPDTLEGKGRGH